MTMGEPDPAELITAAKGGDRGAFGRLYGRYARMVHGIALAQLRAQDADDVVQEVFVRALDQLPSLHQTGAFGGWLVAITRHVIADMFRRAAREAESADEPSGRETQHDEYEARRALEAIRALPEAYRETLTMRLVEGMTGPEIAARTGLTPASVRVNLHRGFKMLRERLEGAALEREG
jgi:RNA polymerase sigma-70 factor (ECF subfamily)